MTEPIKIQPPLTDDVIEKLKAGDRVVITGVIYTGRDMAHKYMVEGHKKGEKLPFDAQRPDPLLYRSHTGTAGKAHRFCRADHELRHGQVHALRCLSWDSRA